LALGNRAGYRDVGSDLGGAVKGFKDGMKEGGSDGEQNAAKLADDSNKKSDTIDVEAKEKSSS
jgi:sec-independent protein translocase protein TatA